MQTQTLPRWIAKRGTSTLTVRAVDYYQARARCAAIGMPEPESIGLVTDHEADRGKAIRSYAELIGR